MGWRNHRLKERLGEDAMRTPRLPIASMPEWSPCGQGQGHAGDSHVSSAASDTPIFLDEEWNRLFQLLRLSPRECQIVRHVFANESEGTIADGLAISSHTVHCHLARLYRKLGVGSRTELVIVVVRAHLLWCHSAGKSHS